MSSLDYYAHVEEQGNIILVRFKAGAASINVLSLKSFASDLAAILEEKIGDSKSKHVLLDMRHVASIDSMGLSQIVKWNRISPVTLFHLQPTVNELLKLTKMDELLHIVADESTALAAAE